MPLSHSTTPKLSKHSPVWALKSFLSAHSRTMPHPTKLTCCILGVAFLRYLQDSLRKTTRCSRVCARQYVEEYWCTPNVVDICTSVNAALMPPMCAIACWECFHIHSRWIQSVLNWAIGR